MSSDKFDSGISIDKRKLSGVYGENLEDAEVLGRAMMFTVGDVLVPSDWLEERCDDLGIPEKLIPSPVRPSSSYKRAMARLLDHANAHLLEVEGRRVELDLRRGDNNVRHLYASVQFSEAETGQEGGKYVTHRLGWFNYDVDSQKMTHHQDDDCPEALDKTWKRLVGMAQGLKKKMANHHTGQDLRLMIHYFRNDYTGNELDVVSLRDGGAVYFIPEGHLTDVVDRMAALFREIDAKFKEGGKHMGIHTLEVIDTEEKREWVRSRVAVALEGLVDDVVEEAFEAFDDDDEAVDEIVRTLGENIGQASNSIEQYNRALESKLKVEEILQRRAESLKEGDAKKELIDKVLSQTDLYDYEG